MPGAAAANLERAEAPTRTGQLVQKGAAEMVDTFFPMFVVTSVATDARAAGQLSRLAIGATVAMCAIFGGSIRGAFTNPARSLGRALVSGHLEHLWSYFTAPLLTAFMGARTHEFIRCAGDRGDASGCC